MRAGLRRRKLRSLARGENASSAVGEPDGEVHDEDDEYENPVGEEHRPHGTELVQIRALLNGSAALRAAILLCLVCAFATGCNGGTVDDHALKRDAEKVSSLATEGGLLANDMSKGASTKYFARVHAKELSQAASDLADA